jgi:hypothetical protein
MLKKSSAFRLLGRTGQDSLVVYWIGALVSQAYLGEYWRVIFLFDSARRLVVREIANPGGAVASASATYLGVPKLGGTAAPAKVALGAADFVKRYS